jgi:serine/threonine protein kinase/tetratricopeptide (TPR) repeat protein
VTEAAGDATEVSGVAPAESPAATVGEGATVAGAAPAAPALGRTGRADEVIAGKYTLVEPIGEGGMGAVWRARQTVPVKRYVAVKLIKAGMDSRQVLARFEAERQALALMDHPNIARVLDGGLHDGRPFFVMELVKGVPITDFCDARRLTPRERLELFVPVCQAIQHAHQKGVIHRDIKPSNVLVALYDDRPVPKVIDFGVAKATGGALTEHTIETAFGGVVGTPQYMSPEQATLNNLDIDTRSDVYALGVLLYELLTGSTPFSRQELERKGVLEILRVVREEEPPRPSTKLSTADALPSLSANRSTEPRALTGLLRSELDWVVMKALEKDRSRRYETANAFAADVRRYLEGEAVQAHPPGAGYRMRKFVRRNKGRVVAAALVLLALLTGIVGTTWGLVHAERARREEAAQRRVAVAERYKAEQSEGRAKEERARAEEQRTRAEARETQAIDAVKRFRDAVANEPELKNSLQLESLRKRLLKEPLAFFKDLRNRLQADHDTHPKSLARLAGATLELGDLTNEIGDMQDAVNAYRESLAIQQKLVQDDPTVTEYQRDLGNCQINLAKALFSTGRFDDAITVYATAETTFQKLIDSKTPDAGEFRNRLAFINFSRGNTFSVMGRSEEAEAQIRQALAHYQRLDDEGRASGPVLEDLSKSHHQLGLELLERGEAAEAETEILRAIAIQQKLIDNHPGVGYHRYIHAYFLTNLSAVHYELGKSPEATADTQRALTICQKLVDENPTVTRYRDYLAFNHINLGGVNGISGQLDDAIAHLGQAEEQYRKLVDDNPTAASFRSGLGICRVQLGNVLTDLGKPAEAEAAYRRALEGLQKLTGDSPNYTEARMCMAMAHNGLGGIHMRAGRLAEAEVEHRRARESVNGQRGEETFLVYTEIGLGKVLEIAGKPAESLVVLREALAEMRKSVDKKPADNRTKGDLAGVYPAVGWLHVREGRFAEALATLDAGVALGRKLLDADPNNLDYVGKVASVHACRGWARVRAGQRAEAIPDLRRALELWAKRRSIPIDMRFERARVEALLAGLAKDPNSRVTPTEATAFADRSVASLRDIMTGGWSLRSELKEPDFDAIGGREDFQKLLSELETKAQSK